MLHAFASVPASTYRLQFHRGFTFVDAANLAGYLARLGVTHCYSSPYLMAQPGSTHGYDICDHNRLNPEVGSAEDYARFVAALREHRLGQILDFVPNHMGNDPRTNPWWRDVLENGPSSAFAHFFDIDWHPGKTELQGKVLLPILGDQYGLVLERGELRLTYQDGRLGLEYFDNRLPIDPRSAIVVFEPAVEPLRRALGEESGDLREFLSILTALKNLPDSSETAAERITERRREKEVARERLARLMISCDPVREELERSVAAFNGTPGEPRTFDLLHGLLEQQSYRLAYWRTASHEINYRRFFDINALAALRMEDPEVFEAAHTLVASLLANGSLSGLRIDHPDGLYDPEQYFERVQDLWSRVAPRTPQRGQPAALYVVAEKILSEGEKLPESWQVAGTTGYQFVALLGGVFVDPAGERPLHQLYARFTRRTLPFPEVVYEGKKLITKTSLASELNVLAQALNRISEGNRRSRDFTLETLRSVLEEVVACFPVYRTYVSGRGWTAADRERIETAVMRARWRNPTIEHSIFDFIREALLPRGDSEESAVGAGERRRNGYAPGGRDDYEARLAFSMKLQQYTAPVQAKGVEDTAFYRFNVLVSLDEVGGDPSRFGRTVAAFHDANIARLQSAPCEMLASSTHDTKLGEDVRARVSVLSEIPSEWRRHLFRWARVNAAHRTIVQGTPAPDRNDEYRFYQVLLGTWPDGERAASPTLVARFRDYMIKAIKEAKVHSSWINDNEAYDQATARFVESVLGERGGSRFLPLFLPLQRRVAELALASSLGQVALKMGAPGVPDTYQGCELWDLHLVDPDNRQAVDFATRAAHLAALEPLIEAAAAGLGQTSGVPAAVAEMLEHWQDGRIKFWVTACALRLRRAFPALFLRGRYLPIQPAGEAGTHLVAFAREEAGDAVLVATLRLPAGLGANVSEWRQRWKSWAVPLPAEIGCRSWVNVLTGTTVEEQAPATSAGGTPAPQGSTPAPQGSTPAPQGSTPAPQGSTPAQQGPVVRGEDLFGPCPVAILYGRKVEG